MEKAKKLIIPFVAILCVVALVYLIFFFGKTNLPSSELTTSTLKEYTISFDTKELKYKNGIDFMQGVTAFDDNGNDLTEYVTVSCKPTDDTFKKTLTYSINKAGYKIDAFERTLLVDSSYKGPSIEIVEPSIEVPIDQIKSLTAIIYSSNAIKTDDGFGGDCGITAIIDETDISLGDYVATITAQNLFGDTATTKITVTVVNPETSIIKLSASSVTIAKGDSFNPMDYVVSANDDTYGDVKAGVVASQDFDTNKIGTYTIEYKIQGIEELKDEVAYLYVTVN